MLLLRRRGMAQHDDDDDNDTRLSRPIYMPEKTRSCKPITTVSRIRMVKSGTSSCPNLSET